jgi:hypothetical protein
MNAFVYFPHDMEANEPWHIDAKDKLPLSEEKRQIAVLRDLHICAPGVMVWAVPNGGKRTVWAAQKAKREGMRAGTPDLTLIWNRGVAFVEMKDGAAMPDANQRDALNRLCRAGHHCGVFRTSASLLRWLKGLGAPVMLREGL